MAFLESWNFSTCVYMQIFIFRDGHVTTFRHSWAYISQMPGGHRDTDSPDYSKRHAFRVSAFHRYHCLGVKLFLYAVRRIVEGYPKTRKCCFWNSGIFHDSTRPHLHFDCLPPKSWRSVVSIWDLRYKYYREKT